MEKLNRDILIANANTKLDAALNACVPIDGYTIEAVINNLGFLWIAPVEDGYILLQDETFGERFFLSPEWDKISYEKTEEEAFDEFSSNADYEYLHQDGGNCIFQTENVVEYYDDDHRICEMRLCYYQHTEDSMPVYIRL